MWKRWGRHDSAAGQPSFQDNQNVTQCLSVKLKSWTGLYSVRKKSNEKNNCNMITKAVSEEHEVMSIILT